MTLPVKVLVVDDHPLARRGVGSLLAEAFPALEWRQSGSTAEAISIAGAFQPNLVVLDLRLPDPPGPAATCAALLERNRHGHIVILTAFAEMDLIRQCLAAGADGVLLKDSEPGELIMSLRHLAAGTRVIDPRVAQTLAADMVSTLRGETEQVVLSPRERDVLELLSEGCSNRQIAARLFVAETTVKGYVASLLSKLGVDSRLQAVVQAAKRGLL
ncbi:MAG: response regulator transcription factor [Nakamurella sp.]